jgi:hypothetical protein
VSGIRGHDEEGDGDEKVDEDEDEGDDRIEDIQPPKKVCR